MTPPRNPRGSVEVSYQIMGRLSELHEAAKAIDRLLKRLPVRVLVTRWHGFMPLPSKAPMRTLKAKILKAIVKRNQRGLR